MAAALPAIQVVSTALGALGAAKSLFGGQKAPAAPVVEAPKVMPSADTASQAALLAKKKAASAQTSGRMSTLLSEGSQSSNTLGG